MPNLPVRRISGDALHGRSERCRIKWHAPVLADDGLGDAVDAAHFDAVVVLQRLRHGLVRRDVA